jgi:hypothetical protein
MADGTTPAARPQTPGASASSDWPAAAADAIERTIGTVRDKTTGPAITVARGVVYGTFALLVGSVVAIFVAISAVRALDVYLPDSVFGDHHTWAAEAMIGAVFALAGMALWSRRKAKPGAE